MSGTGIRVGSSWWIFDCGEGTQHQSIHKDSLVSTGSITRIFSETKKKDIPPLPPFLSGSVSCTLHPSNCRHNLLFPSHQNLAPFPRRQHPPPHPRTTLAAVTHLHGDHCFGLPGLLCKMGTDQADRVVEVVGPPGLRALLRHTLSATYTGLTYRYVVHELHWPAHTPGRPGRATGEAAAAESGAHESTHRCEIRGENVQQGYSWLGFELCVLLNAV